MNLNQVKRAFTLVELLAVLILLGILSAMVITATNGVLEQAKETRTEKIIAAIDSVIQEQYRSYKYRPLAVEIPDLFNPTNTTDTLVGFEVLAPEAARVRLMMLRDLQRMELPDRLTDIFSAPSRLKAAANPVIVVAGEVEGTRQNRGARRMFDVTWFNAGATYASTNDNVPAKLAAYRERIQSIESLTGSTFNITGPSLAAQAARANQGAECLYLIMATSYVGSGPALDVIPESNIGDTDGDGLQEILDGWGQPLEFVRWPVGYQGFDQSTIVDSFDPNDPVRTPVPDDFDLFRVDYAYTKDPASASAWTPAVPINVNRPATASVDPRLKPWSMRPLIFSRGPNREGGIATNPWADATVPLNPLADERPEFSYRDTTWDWPVNPSSATGPYYGIENAGRDQGVAAPHAFPDPYLRRFVATNGGTGFDGLLPGQLLPTTTAVTAFADNITNYQLQSTPRP